MRAFCYLSLGKAGFLEKEKPTLGAADVIVKPLMVSPCTSDVHNVEYGFCPEGRTLGHEGIGEIIAKGSFVKDFNVGDKVVIPAITADFGTVLSQKGVAAHCNGPFTGNIISTVIDGLMADECMIPNADMNLAPLPSDVSEEAAVMATDMMTTGVYAAEMADIKFGDTVVVVGIGPVGLMAVAGAKLRGAGRIIAVGSRRRCVELAKHYGATDIVNYKDGDIVKQVWELTNHKMCDACIITGGDEAVINQGLSMVRYGGNVSNVNYFTTRGNLEFSNSRWGFGMSNKTLRCGLTPGGRARMEDMLNLVRYGRIDSDLLITHKFEGFNHIEDAFNLMCEKPSDLVKTCVRL